MFDIIGNIFSWIVNAITDIVTIIVAIPTYTVKLIAVINSVIPTQLLVFFMLMFTAYVIIHIKRLII